jgi:NADP-dependent 3-hydroxy acid dehydrogenase YdfG
MENYSGKVAVITGGASGIGYAIAEAIGKKGCKVVITDINTEWGKESLDKLTAQGIEAAFIAHDVTKEENWDAMIAEVKAKYSEIHYLFNNAGIMLRARPLSKCTLRDWQWLMDVNFWGVLFGLRKFTDIMMAQACGGLICTTCSTASVAPFAMWAPYTTTKAAALRVVETYQAEANYMKNTKVRYAAVMPGTVVSNISDCECYRPEAYCNPGEPKPEKAPISLPGTPEGDAIGKISAETCVERMLKQLDYGYTYIYTHRDLTTGLMLEQLNSMLLNKPVTDQLVYDFTYYKKKMMRAMPQEK